MIKMLSIRRRIRALAAATLAVALLVLAGAITATPAQANVSSNFCYYGAFIGVRGTNAAAGQTPVHNNRVWVNGGMGSGITTVSNKLKQTGAAPLAHYALNYPASADIPSSLTRGRDTLVAEINWLVEQCGSYTPAIVLAGYSQGGSVIMKTLADVYDGSANLSPRGRAAIVAAAVIAEPFYSPNQPYNDPSSSPSGSGRLGQWAPEMRSFISSNYQYWGFPYPGGSQGTVYKVRSWCSSQDYWCAGSNSSNAQSVHNNAGEFFANAAKDWIDYMTTAY